MPCLSTYTQLQCLRQLLIQRQKKCQKCEYTIYKKQYKSKVQHQTVTKAYRKLLVAQESTLSKSQSTPRGHKLSEAYSHACNTNMDSAYLHLFAHIHIKSYTQQTDIPGSCIYTNTSYSKSTMYTHYTTIERKDTKLPTCRNASFTSSFTRQKCSYSLNFS